MYECLTRSFRRVGQTQHWSRDRTLAINGLFVDPLHFHDATAAGQAIEILAGTSRWTASTWRSRTAQELSHADQRIWGTPCIVLDEPTDALELNVDFHDQDVEIVLGMFAMRRDVGREKLLAVAGC
ncbi:MAG: hypothetical protein N2C14_02040 [Planctomycetales bacterium]